MNKDMSFYSQQTEYHERFSKLSGIMQFPVISKESLRNILKEEELKYFAEKMEEYEEKGLVKENDDNYTLTTEGVFWGNNLSGDVIIYVMEKIFNK